MPRASASVTTIPYVSVLDGVTTRSAAAYTASRSRPTRGPVNRRRSPTPAASAWPRTRAANGASPLVDPTHVQVHSRSATSASASMSTSCPFVGVTAPTQTSRPPVALPGTTSAGSTPGWHDAHPVRRQAVRPQQPAAGPPARRDHRCRCVEDRALPASRCSSSVPHAEGEVHEDHQPQSAPPRARRTSGAAEATRPSSSTTAPSGMPASVAARADRDALSARGHSPAAPCSRTVHPEVDRPSQTRRSYVFPPLGRVGSSTASGTTTCTVLMAPARRTPTRRATRAA